MGGRASFLLARQPRDRRGGRLLRRRHRHRARVRSSRPSSDASRELKTPWLGLFGDEDGSIPVDRRRAATRGARRDAPVDTEVVRYAGAKHGFHCDRRPDYDEAAAKDGWARTLRWFEAHLAA